MPRLSPVALAAALLIPCGCGEGPRPMDLTVMNLSDEEIEVSSVDAPEFLYHPPLGRMSRAGKSRARASRVVRGAPRAVAIEVAGRPTETVAVPPLPTDRPGEVGLLVVYSRSRRWVAQWEVPSDPEIVSAPTRLHDDDPRYHLHLALLKAAEQGDVGAVDDLVKKGAPLRWDTTRSNPLAAAALRNRARVVERLLSIGPDAFPAADIEEAVVLAADGNNEDIGCLRLLVSRFGAGLGPEARARALRTAAESHRMDANDRLVPTGPAIRYLVDEAKFDVNMPLTPAGHTALDLASGANERFRDEPLVEFLKARGARPRPLDVN
jgi:hypothetical protein